MIILVRLELCENANEAEVLENLDYEFKHEAIIDTEILGKENQE